jgi:hypothetical protein
LPVSIPSAWCDASQSGARPISRAVASLRPTQWGAGSGVGRSDVKKAGPSAAKRAVPTIPDDEGGDVAGAAARATAESVAAGAFMEWIFPAGDLSPGCLRAIPLRRDIAARNNDRQPRRRLRAPAWPDLSYFLQETPRCWV